MDAATKSTMAEHPPGAIPQPKDKKKQATYPDPIVTSPTSTHTHTLILLHGRGSHGAKVGLEFLLQSSSHISNGGGGQTLPQLFPGLQIRLPHGQEAPLDRAEPDPDQPVYDGLCETTAHVHALLRAEEKVVGPKNVILGGLSQGCVMASHVLLSYDLVIGGEILSSMLMEENASASRGFFGGEVDFDDDDDDGEGPFADDLQTEEEEDGGGGDDDNNNSNYKQSSKLIKAANFRAEYRQPPRSRRRRRRFTFTATTTGIRAHARFPRPWDGG
ncbi:MAG: hypothetical protein M1816_003636 [Peltula sp. TS41687]|nr:MAG: hypothetical protein M1816_003636 [Peltula sp. TS41687]